MLSRREFSRSLGAGIALLPFISPTAWGASRAAAPTPRRIIFITSLGTNYSVWRPKSAPGQPLVLSQALSPLAAIADRLTLIDGLSFPNPAEGHSTPQTLTGYTFATGYGPTCTSVDQYIAAKVGTGNKLGSLLLGWQAKNEGQFWQGGRRLTPMDIPSDAWQVAFGSSAPVAAAAGAQDEKDPLPRQKIWDLVHAQLGALRASVGADAQARLDAHLQSLAALERGANGGALAAGCVPPAQPTLGGADAEADTSSDLVSRAHIDLIAAALSCDVTRVVGMQWGVSNRQYIAAPVADDEHSAVHSGEWGMAKLIAAEQYLSSWVVALVQALTAAADPLAPGQTLMDNTMILWTRDIGDGPTHMQYSMPYALVGGAGYLKQKAGGAYYSFGGDNAAATVGAPHQRLLLNACEYMGVTQASDFGTVSKLAAAQQAPLPDIRA